MTCDKLLNAWFYRRFRDFKAITNNGKFGVLNRYFPFSSRGIMYLQRKFVLEICARLS